VRRAVAALVSFGLLGAACSSSSASAERRITVFAAASLVTAFDTIAKEFERADPNVTVRISYGPSDGLAQQIQQGAPADVFASASETWMDAVAKDPGVHGRVDFARNLLTLVVPASNPANIHSVGDLAKTGVELVLAAPGVPAGEYAREILAKAGVEQAALANLVSNEIDVRGVLQKVESGDADVGIAYVTDVRTAGSTAIRAIPIPRRLNVLATYPIGVVDGSGDAADARAFVRYVLGPGQVALLADGFIQKPS
jgi:molybdate transport system substrate-binding protein